MDNSRACPVQIGQINGIASAMRAISTWSTSVQGRCNWRDRTAGTGVGFGTSSFDNPMTLPCLFLTVAAVSISFQVLYPQQTQTRHTPEKGVHGRWQKRGSGHPASIFEFSNWPSAAQRSRHWPYSDIKQFQSHRSFAV